MPVFTRRFKEGEYRYSTRAFIEKDAVIIHQTERCDHPKLELRSVVVLSVADFRQMIKVLGVTIDSSK